MRTLVLVAMAAAVSGCGSMSGLGGSAEFACQAPEGVVCTSVSGVYANSMAGTLPAQRDPDAGRAKPTHARTEEVAEKPALVRPHPYQAAPYVSAGPLVAGEPLLTPARVMRLWIAPFTDEDGDLHGDTYVYVMWDRGEWKLPHTQAQIRRRFAPIVRADGQHVPAAQQQTLRTQQEEMERKAADDR